MSPSNKNANVARTLAELRQLSVRDQGMLLLRRLALNFPRGQSFAKQNFRLLFNSAPDPYGLATGFPQRDVPDVVEHLLGEPWHYLEQNFYIHSLGPGFFEITEKGWSAEKDADVYVPDANTIAALTFMHKDLQGYGHYFRERKQKEAVAAAFRRVENRLNEVREPQRSHPIQESVARRCRTNYLTPEISIFHFQI